MDEGLMSGDAIPEEETQVEADDLEYEEGEDQARLRQFGQFCKWMREERGLSLRDVGKALGVAYQTYYNMERGHRHGKRVSFTEPTIHHLMRLSELFRVPLPVITYQAWGVPVEVAGGFKPPSKTKLKIMQVLNRLADDLDQIVNERVQEELGKEKGGSGLNPSGLLAEQSGRIVENEPSPGGDGSEPEWTERFGPIWIEQSRTLVH